MRRVEQGPNGLALVLDTSKQGPERCVVEHRGGRATLETVMLEECVYRPDREEIRVPDRCMKWLESKPIRDLVAACENVDSTEEDDVK